MLCEVCKWNSCTKRLIKDFENLKQNDYVIVLKIKIWKIAKNKKKI
jgi:hypothetical protein